MTEKLKIIETKDIPKTTKTGKTSKIPQLLEQIPKGKTAEVPNGQPHKIATVRSYIQKQHKGKKLLQFQLQQRTSTDDHKKLVTLYIIHK
jgi:hypothetical protein